MLGRIVLALTAMLLGHCFLVEAQQPGKVPRIGLVSQGSVTAVESLRLDALREGLRELGWVEGRNIAIERRSAEGKRDRADVIADEIVRVVDVVVWSGGVEAAKKIKTIPVVFVGTSDPVSTGLVESLARPGGNVTGLTSLAPELGGKRLELLKETSLRSPALFFYLTRLTQAMRWNWSNCAGRLPIWDWHFAPLRHEVLMRSRRHFQ
jgi:putative tryptophan/tyrosine transport system substrate-binding protein